MLRERLQRDGDAAPDAVPRRQPEHPGRRRHDQTEEPSSSESPALDEMADAFLHLPDAVVLVDGTGTILWGNVAAERIFGRSLQEWVGRSGIDLVHPDDHEFVLRSLGTI
ncbi:MAG TPA: PAS domain-containing protein, partial [Acidimicrobiales bacterium]|nr:PAS domain-containing protein [Acidimicrobiales bacterium]